MKNILNQLLKTCLTTGKFRGINWSNIWSVAAPLADTSVCLDILPANFPKTETEESGNYGYDKQIENNKLIFLR
jgi:hypothetical protein